MALRCHGAATWALRLSVRYVLPECAGSLDGGLVHLLVLPDIVDGAVTSNGADLCALSTAGAVGGVLLNVVFNERVCSPAVDGDENGSSGGGGRSIKGDVACCTSLPALADDEVACSREGHTVARVAGAEVDVAAGLVVLVVVLAAENVLGGEIEVRSINIGVCCWGGEDAGGGGQGEGEGAESNHVGRSIKAWKCLWMLEIPWVQVKTCVYISQGLLRVVRSSGAILLFPFILPLGSVIFEFRRSRQ